MALSLRLECPYKEKLLDSYLFFSGHQWQGFRMSMALAALVLCLVEQQIYKWLAEMCDDNCFQDVDA